jgi:hypothetical protein
MDAKLLVKILRDCFRLDSIKYPNADVLTLAHDNDRSLEIDSRWYSPLVNTLEDDLSARGVRSISIARIISRIKGDRAFGSVYSPEGAFARALVIKRISGVIIGNIYPYSTYEEKIWEKILDESQVRFVIGIQPSRELCTVCRKRRIWVADIQHGVIADEHPWYGEGFRSREPINWLPNAFLVWDNESVLPIARWASRKGIDVIPIGNRWVIRFITKNKEDQVLKKIINQFQVLNHQAPAKPQILVTLSWGNKNIPNGFLPVELCEVIRETTSEYNWLLRLHPNQLNGFATDEGRSFNFFYKQHLVDAVDWDRPTRLPLPLVLSESDLHISWNSSVAIEAALMGVKSALMDPRLESKRSYYKGLRSTGMVSFIKPEKITIKKWIKNNLGSKTIPPSVFEYNKNYDQIINTIALSINR